MDSQLLRFVVYRRHRAASVLGVAKSVLPFLRSCSEIHAAGREWFTIDGGYQQVRVTDASALAPLLEQGRSEWDPSMRRPDDPSHQVRFFTIGDDAIEVALEFTLEEEPTNPPWGIHLKAQLACPALAGSGVVRMIFVEMIRTVTPDWGLVGTRRHPRVPGSPRRAMAGWLTYLAGRRAFELALPPSATIEVIDSLGTAILAHPDPIRDRSRLQLEAILEIDRGLAGLEEAQLPPANPMPMLDALPPHAIGPASYISPLAQKPGSQVVFSIAEDLGAGHVRTIAAQDINATAEIRSLPEGPALPFKDKSDAGEQQLTTDQPRLPPPRRDPRGEVHARTIATEDINATAEIRSVPEGPALPFKDKPDVGWQQLATDQLRLTPPRRDVRDETSALPAIQIEFSLPFVKTDAPQSRVSDFAGSTKLRAGPLAAPIPFSDASRVSPQPPIPETPKAPASRRDPRDETSAPPSIGVLKPSLPFGNPAAFDGTVGAPGGRDSFHESPISRDTSDLNALTLEQYASLCAELAVQREARDVVLRRYGIADEESRKQQDLHWGLRMRESEPLAAKFRELLATFRAYLERGQHG